MNRVTVMLLTYGVTFLLALVIGFLWWPLLGLFGPVLIILMWVFLGTYAGMTLFVHRNDHILHSDALVNGLNKEVRYVEHGMHLKYPWESLDPSRDDIDLEAQTISIDIDLPTSDDSHLFVRGGLQYRPDPERLNTYMKQTNEAIRHNLESFVLSCIADFFADKTSEQLTGKNSELQRNIREQLTEDVIKGFRNNFGVEIEADKAWIDEIDYPEGVRALRRESYEGKIRQENAEKIRKTAEDFKRGTPDISDADALKAAMVAHGKATEAYTTTTNRHVAEGSGAEALGAAILQFVQGGNRNNRGGN